MEDDLDLVLHTVGLLVQMRTDGEPLASLIMMTEEEDTEKCEMLCVLLDATSSLMLSPFFKHRLLLRQTQCVTVNEKPGTSLERKEEAFDLPHYSVREWKQWAYRMNREYTSKELVQPLCRILETSLFIQMKCHDTNSDTKEALFRRHIAPFLAPTLIPTGKGKKFLPFFLLDERSGQNLSVESLYIKSVLRDFLQQSEAKGRLRQNLYARYWNAIRKKSLPNNLDVHDVIDATVYQLNCLKNSKSEKADPRLWDVGALQRYLMDSKSLSPVHRYMSYRICDFEDLKKVHQTLNTLTQSDQPGLPAILRFHQLDTPLVADLDRFANLVKSLVLSPGSPKVAAQMEAIEFKQFRRLLQVSLAGHMNAVFEVLTSKYCIKVPEKKEKSMRLQLRASLLRSVLVRAVVALIEYKARLSSGETRSTVYGVTFNDLLYCFKVLLGLDTTAYGEWINESTKSDDETGCRLSQLMIEMLSSSTLDDKDEEGNKKMNAFVRGTDFVFTIQDFLPLVNTLWHMKRLNGRRMGELPWICRARKDLHEKNPLYITLFFIECDAACVSIERQTRLLVERYITSAGILSSPSHLDFTLSLNDLICMNEDNTRDDSLDLDRRSVEIEFVTFTPLEMKCNEDVHFIEGIVKENFHTSSILLEGDNFFLRQRLSRHFNETRQYDMKLLHQETAFPSCVFGSMSSEAAREFVLIPDAHNFSVMSMNQLLQWLIRNRVKLKRVLLIGSLFMKPSASGHAFYDLLQRFHPKEARTNLSSENTAITSRFDEVLEKWRVIECLVNEKMRNDLAYTLPFFLENGFSILYDAANLAMCQRLLEWINEKKKYAKNVVFCLLHKKGSSRPCTTSVASLNELPEWCRILPEGWRLSGGVLFEELETSLICEHKVLVMPEAIRYAVVSRRVLSLLNRSDLFHVLTKFERIIVIRSDASDTDDTVDPNWSAKERKKELSLFLGDLYRNSKFFNNLRLTVSSIF